MPPPPPLFAVLIARLVYCRRRRHHYTVYLYDILSPARRPLDCQHPARIQPTPTAVIALCSRGQGQGQTALQIHIRSPKCFILLSWLGELNSPFLPLESHYCVIPLLTRVMFERFRDRSSQSVFWIYLIYLPFTFTCYFIINTRKSRRNSQQKLCENTSGISKKM